MHPDRHNELHGDMDREGAGTFHRGRGRNKILGDQNADTTGFKDKFYEDYWNKYPDAACDYFIQKL
jgi:hypothetical protein